MQTKARKRWHARGGPLGQRDSVARRALRGAVLGFSVWAGATPSIGCTPRPAPVLVQPASPPTTAPPTTAPSAMAVLRPAAGALPKLLAAVDRDDDKRITVLDGQGKVFDLPLAGGGTYRVSGTYHLANLVQELKLAEGEGRPTVEVARIVENPVERLARSIRDRYWQALTRRVDAKSMGTVLPDPKMDDRRQQAESYAGLLADCTSSHDPNGVPWFLYVPHDDPLAFERYAAIAREDPRLIVCRMPDPVTADWVFALTGGAGQGSRHGLLALAWNGDEPVPYVVPGGRFNELYGWDSYFHVLGLVNDGKLELARGVVDNLDYEVRHYGKILNANRTYYLTRSQPPFLSSMVRELAERLQGPSSKPWLTRLVDTVIREYEDVWTSEPRRTAVCLEGVCLSRYFGTTIGGTAIGQPPEVEAGHFDWLYAPRAQALGLDVAEYERRYLARTLAEPELRALDEAFVHDRCMRESGHDTTYRWTDPKTGRDHCADFATVDLNALLLKTELDVAYLIASRFGGTLQRERCTGGTGGTVCRTTAEDWCVRARKRALLLREQLWDPERHLFFDLDVRTRKRSRYISATSFYPLWATGENICHVRLFDDQRQTAELVAALLQHLEQPGGLSATARPAAPPVPERQWEYPNGWPPHQILAWQALRQYGYSGDADRLTWRWLSMILQNARDYHGTVPEKFDVVARSHRVYSEYGNVNTEFSYIATEGFGWMNASCQVGLASMSPELRQRLRAAAESAARIPLVP